MFKSLNLIGSSNLASQPLISCFDSGLAINSLVILVSFKAFNIFYSFSKSLSTNKILVFSFRTLGSISCAKVKLKFKYSLSSANVLLKSNVPRQRIFFFVSILCI